MNKTFRQSFKTKLQPIGERPDLTPFFGLFFLLLLFFMLGSSFVQVSGIKVELPDVGAQSVIGVEKYVIAVAYTGKEPEISFNERLVNMDSLAKELVELSSRSGSETVILSADKRVPFEITAKIMALAERARLTLVIATLPPREKGETVFERNY